MRVVPENVYYDNGYSVNVALSLRWNDGDCVPPVYPRLSLTPSLKAKG